jgi:protein-S-isoprenylcysteine O-methyltransferase Ste14
MNTKQKLVSPVLMWLIVIAGIYAAFQTVPSGFIYPRNMFTSFFIIPAVAYWSYFFAGAVLVHRKAPLSADKIDRLVTEGVYGKVRHPIYSADILLSWSVSLFYPDARFFLSALWLTCVLLFWMDREERALSEKFGQEYLDYMSRVPKMFPKF